MTDNQNDVVKIRVELDTGQLNASVSGTEAAINKVSGATRSFFDLEKSQLQRLKEAWDERKNQIRSYAKELGTTQTQVKGMMALHNQNERAAKREADAVIREEKRKQREYEQTAKQQQAAAQRQQRQNAQAARFPGTAVLGNATSTSGAIFGAVLAGSGAGGGFLPTVGGVAAGALGASLPVIGGVVAGLSIINGLIDTGVGLVKDWVGVWYEYRTAIERSKIGLSVLLGSQQQAGEFVKDLIKDLRGLGDLDSALVLSRRLLNVGLAADEARQKVVELTKLSVGLGLGTQEQKGLAKALSDTATAQRLRGQEVLQFNNAGVAVKKIVGEYLGIAQREVEARIKKGLISDRVVFGAISKEAEKYTAAFEAALLLPENSINRIKQNLGRIGDGVFSNLFGDLASELKAAADQLEHTDAFDDAIYKLGADFAIAGGGLAGRLVGGIVGYLSDPSNLYDLAIAAQAIPTLFAFNLFQGVKKGFGFGNNYSTFSGTNQPFQSDGDEITPGQLAANRNATLHPPKAKPDAGGGGGGGRKSHKKSFSESLRDRVERAKENFRALTNLNSKDFDAKFEGEKYERLNRDLEAILNLRYELGVEFAKPLPKTPEAAQALKDELESAKRVYDAVKRAKEENLRATEELAIAIQTQSIPVVDAETRYQTQYLKLLRERKDEEQQLTADLKLEVRKRIDALTDEEEQARSTRLSRVRVFTNTLREGADARQAALDARTRRALIEGDGDVFDLIGENSASRTLPPVQNIDRNVAAIFDLLKNAFGFGGSGAPTGNNSATGVGSFSDDTTFRIPSDALYFNDARKQAIKDRLDAELDNRVSDLYDEIERLTRAEERYNDSAYSGTLHTLEAKRRLLDSQRELREQTEEASLRQIDLQRELNELNDAGSKRTALRRREADNDILKSQVATKEEIIRLQEEIAHASEGAADRYHQAWLEATLDVAQRNEEAVKTQIRAQVELSQKTIFSSEQARANILDTLSKAKGVTEIYSDAFLTVTDAIGNGITGVLERTTAKLGLVGRLVTDIGSQLLKLVTNRLMIRLLDFLLPAGNGGGGGGGGYALPTGFGGGGGGGAAVYSFINGAGSFLTPGFNGGSIGGLGTFTGNAASGLNVVGVGPRGVPIFAPSSLPRLPGVQIPGAGGGRAAGGNFLSRLFGGAGGGLLPALGFGLGAGVGGQSVLGSILGGLGGGAIGLGLSYGAAVFGAGGGFGAAALAALGPAALIGIPLLVGGWLLGRAKQRRADEQTADTYWVEYKDRLIELTRQVKANRIDGDDALSEAAKARQTAIDQIMTIKTKSVRESRLKNQITDVDRLFLEPLKKAVEEQKQRRSNADKLIPEFAIGGVVPGPRGAARLVIAHGGEIIANEQQQTPELVAAAKSAGIPGVRGNAGNTSSAPIEVTLVMGTEQQNQMFVNGAKSPIGYRTLVKTQTRAARLSDLG